MSWRRPVNSSEAGLSSWPAIARKIRVPLGFVLAALYLWLARPTATSIIAGCILVLPGLALRGVASGFVQKNTQLTTAGPYAYTRNPLYLGSLILAAAFAVAARSLWIVVILIVLFVVIYLPVVRAEEDFLRAQFPEFSDYARRVPRFLPRRHAPEPAGGKFSSALYWKHREYNALLGSAVIMAALVAKLFWFSR
jgi:protein-S-isoprenylcysteine O-methyltransferase Ste14